MISLVPVQHVGSTTKLRKPEASRALSGLLEALHRDGLDRVLGRLLVFGCCFVL